MLSHNGPFSETVPTVVADGLIIVSVTIPANGSNAVTLQSLLSAPTIAALEGREVVSVAAQALAADWFVGDGPSDTPRKVVAERIYNPPVRNWLDKYVRSDGAAMPLAVEIFSNPYKGRYVTDPVPNINP